jgi:hypothetical protein
VCAASSAAASIAAGLAGFALFCRRQATAADPLLVPSLLKNRGFTSGLVMGLVFFAAVSGVMYVLSLFVQDGLGRTPTGASLALSPIAAGIIAAAFASRPLIGPLGRRLLLIGLALTLAGTGWLLGLVHAHGTETGAWGIAPALFLMGLGMGSCFGTLFDITLGDVTPEQAGGASGALSAVQQLSAALGSAAMTTVYFRTLDGHDQTRAVSDSLAVVLGATVLCCGLVWLLPRDARPGEHQ